MAKTMTPSENISENITAGQIGKIQELLGAALRKSGLRSEPTQQVLETQGDSLLAEMVAVVRKRVEAVSNMIVRHVCVDRSRTPQEALDATGRKQYVNESVVHSMPHGEGEEVDVYFFSLDYDPTLAELEKEYELRGLVADPMAQAKVNEADPTFADERPNGCQWDLEEGVASFADFGRKWGVERDVYVRRSGSWWSRRYRFGGVCK